MNAFGLRLRLAAALLVWIGLLAPPASATDLSEVRAQPTRGRKIYDAAVLRPLSGVNLIAGVTCFAVAYPVTLVTGGTSHVHRYCWEEPVDRTFRRPLGEL